MRSVRALAGPFFVLSGAMHFAPGLWVRLPVQAVFIAWVRAAMTR